jgi:hypothetical protein
VGWKHLNLKSSTNQRKVEIITKAFREVSQNLGTCIYNLLTRSGCINLIKFFLKYLLKENFFEICLEQKIGKVTILMAAAEFGYIQFVQAL